MSWYVLKNRRHVGPYQDFELVAMHRRQMIGTDDFVISEENMGKGELIYERVCDAVKLDEVPDDPRKPAVARKEKESEAEPLLGTFTEDELLHSEVSKVFTEAMESVDLVTHPSPSSAAAARKEVSRVYEAQGAAPQATLNPRIEKRGLAEFWEQYQKPAVAMIMVLAVGSGIYSFRSQLGLGKLFDTASLRLKGGSKIPPTIAHAPATNPGLQNRAPAGSAHPPTIRVPEVRHDDPGPPPNHEINAYVPPPAPIEPEREPAGSRDENDRVDHNPPSAAIPPHIPGPRAAVPGAPGQEQPFIEDGNGERINAVNGANEDEEGRPKPVPAKPPAGDNANPEDYENR